MPNFKWEITPNHQQAIKKFLTLKLATRIQREKCRHENRCENSFRLKEHKSHIQNEWKTELIKLQTLYIKFYGNHSKL